MLGDIQIARIAVDQSSTWEWDQYWQSARLAACDGAEGFNYRESIQSAWRSFLARQGDGRTLVDIATGNGAIPLLARDIASENDWGWQIAGVDSASIDPPSYLGSAGIDTSGVEFLGNTPAEQLPFPDGSVDIITSQYGLEYTDMPPVVKEIARVQKSGGVFQFITHAAEGGIVHSANTDVMEMDFLLNEATLFRAADEFFRAVRAVESSESPPTRSRHERCMETKEQFEEAFKQVAARAATMQNPQVFDYVTKTILDMHKHRAKYELDSMLGKIGAVHDAVRAHRARLRANVDCALSSEQLSALSASLERVGLIVEHRGPLMDESNESMIGWILSGRR